MPSCSLGSVQKSVKYREQCFKVNGGLNRLQHDCSHPENSAMSVNGSPVMILSDLAHSVVSPSCSNYQWYARGDLQR